MICSELATKIQSQYPEASPAFVARQCLMLLNTVNDPNELRDDAKLQTILSDCRMQYHAATDQHAAMTQELEELASSDPREFTPDQIWILVRSIKVQSQILKLYAGSVATTTT